MIANAEIWEHYVYPNFSTFFRPMFFKTKDGSFLDSNGKILYFSTERFIKDICENDDYCFICGIKQSETTFNDEHIIPNWILKKYNLHNQSITLPNKTKFQNKYSGYKIR